jgi:hypothetical protein
MQRAPRGRLDEQPGASSDFTVFPPSMDIFANGAHLMNRTGWIAAATVLVVLAPAFDARAQGGNRRAFGDLLKRIPAQSNALLLVNVDGLYDSPMGRRENWRERARENPSGHLGISPDVSRFAVAVGMDFQSMDERWRIGMAQHRNPLPSLEAVAAREGGYVETIEKMPVAWTPRGFDLFQFPDQIVGFVSPTDRKAIVGWIRTVLDHPRNFPPGFADRAIFRADAGAQIVLALDLADSVSPKMVEPWLNAIDVIKKTHTDPTLLAPRLASVKSAFLVITADQSLEGNIRIDFEREVDYTAPVARELILTLLDDYGADLPELKSWTLSFDKKTAVEMNGRLSEESVRRVISLARPPHLSSSGPDASKAPTQPPAEPKPVATQVRSEPLIASQAYFRSVTSLIEALKQTNRPTYRSTKLWYDRYAKQIEELPILNVDKDLLDWGSQVTRTLREMSSGVNYYARNQTYTLASSSSGSYGGYDSYAGGSRAYDQSVIKKQSDAMMSVDLDTRWQAVESSIADMRRKMVEKYKVDF